MEKYVKLFRSNHQIPNFVSLKTVHWVALDCRQDMDVLEFFVSMCNFTPKVYKISVKLIF